MTWVANAEHVRLQSRHCDSNVWSRYTTGMGQAYDIPHACDVPGTVTCCSDVVVEVPVSNRLGVSKGSLTTG